jgi:hypothetical protein
MSKGREGLLSSGEAAEFLGITVPGLRYWKKRGVLKPRYREANGRRGEYYDPVELGAFKQAQQESTDPKTLQLLVAQTHATAQMNKRRIDAIEALLGVSSRPLSVKKIDVRTLWDEAIRDSSRIINGKEKVSFWADKLFGITDHYLEVVAKVVGVEDPWRPFLELSRTLRLHQDWDATYTDIEAQMTYHRLHTAAAFLNANVFAYCVQTFGLKKAMATIPKEFGNEHFDIMLHATEH